jgi:hypothetical protein
MSKLRRQLWIILGALVMVLGLAFGAWAEVSGVYELKDKGESRRLEITEMKAINSLQFSLYVQSSNFSGSMFGLADLKGNTATYKTSGCQLTITFTGNKAVISNANLNCRDYLKPGVLLDGTYIKK